MHVNINECQDEDEHQDEMSKEKRIDVESDGKNFLMRTVVTMQMLTRSLAATART